jgi:hypothetical protein
MWRKKIHGRKLHAVLLQPNRLATQPEFTPSNLDLDKENIEAEIKEH